MRKHITKFIAAFVLIVVAVTMVMMGTYAWFVLSTDPAAGNMTVSVGSAEAVTILIAPDVTDESGYHFPGAFEKTLNLGASDAYDLSGLSGLVPVSTADGRHWYGADYDALENGGALRGYKELGASAVNVTNGETDDGSYVCLDFWVVSPNDDYTLRVATELPESADVPDAFDAGSFVLSMPVLDADGHASVTRTSAEASIRVGFLVDETALNEDVLKAYYDSDKESHREYSVLHGTFGENAVKETDPDTGVEAELGPTYRFTIYEPNGDLHPDGAIENGLYQVTSPLGPDAETNAVVEQNVSDRLTVQATSAWAKDPREDGKTLIQSRLDTPSLEEQAAADPVAYLFNTSLQGQLAGYVLSGGFVSDTTALYAENGPASLTANTGATDNVFLVELKENEPQRIRMFIWLEGQDADCVNSAQGGDLIINIELAGASVSGNTP